MVPLVRGQHTTRMGRAYMPDLYTAGYPITSHLVEEVPVLDYEGLPYPRGIFDGVSDKPTLFSQLKIDIFLVIFALDVRDIDGDEDIGRLLFKAEKCQNYGREVRRGRGL